jgi:hypothetical protein
MFLARRKRITARTSQMTRLSITEHVIIHSVETRTNTRWTVMWWFTRPRDMCCYVTCTSSPPLLHLLPKINRGYFPNIPHSISLARLQTNLCISCGNSSMYATGVFLIDKNCQKFRKNYTYDYNAFYWIQFSLQMVILGGPLELQCKIVFYQSLTPGYWTWCQL